jgi:hypothetical protein
MSRPLLIIHHFYNEPLLLPFWLKHHRGMADHVVLIDHHSTDNSVQICRELMPEAEIITSRNPDFSAPACDAEVMEIEKRYSGWWKIALNTTEHIFHPNAKEWLTHKETFHPHTLAFGVQSVVMCDLPEQWNSPVDFDTPLYEQRFWGYRDVAPYHEQERRPRYFHRHEHGHYDTGRHRVFMPDHYFSAMEDPFLLWWGFSPYPQIEGRKLQIQTRLPESERHSFAFGHRVTKEEFEARVRHHATLSYNLMEQPWYVSAVEQMRTKI